MKVKIPVTAELYPSGASIAHGYLSGFEHPWEALPGITEVIERLGEALAENDFERFGKNVWIAKSATVAPSSLINGPCIIDEGAEIRHCAYIRGSVIVGKAAVVGNSTELKNCILFDGVQVPHYNYVGDSILGYKAHFGAGAITSNVKCDKTLVAIKNKDECLETEMKKCGAFVGDFAEIGCGAVLNPGTVIGKRSVVYPLSSVRGVINEECIYKKESEIVRISKNK